MFPVFKKKNLWQYLSQNNGNAIFASISEYDKQKKNLPCFKHTPNPYFYPLNLIVVTTFHQKAVTKYLKENHVKTSTQRRFNLKIFNGHSSWGETDK